MNKKMKIFFTLSILANVLLAGAVVGMAVERHREMHAPWTEAAREDLSPEGQKIVAEAFKEGWKKMLPYMKQAGDQRRYLSKVISADTFSEAEFDRVSDNLFQVQHKINDHKKAAAKSLIEKLSVEDRKKFAESMARSFTWRGGDRNKGWRTSSDHPRSPHEEGDDDHKKSDD